MIKEEVNILIVEDDPLIAMDIQDIVTKNGYNVIALFHNAKDVFDADLSKITLALLDITIEGNIDGIDVGVKLWQTFKIPCIFITSYYDSQTVTKASKANPLAFILKPYEEKDILVNLELSLEKLVSKTQNKKHNTIFVKSSGKLTKIKIENVTYLQAFDMYTYIFYDNQRILASQTLKEIQKTFEPYNFVRVHRSYMVNFNCIDGIFEDEVLIGENRIPIGRTYKKNLFELIKTI